MANIRGLRPAAHLPDSPEADPDRLPIRGDRGQRPGLKYRAAGRPVATQQPDRIGRCREWDSGRYRHRRTATSGANGTFDLKINQRTSRRRMRCHVHSRDRHTISDHSRISHWQSTIADREGLAPRDLVKYTRGWPTRACWSAESDEKICSEQLSGHGATAPTMKMESLGRASSDIACLNVLFCEGFSNVWWR